MPALAERARDRVRPVVSGRPAAREGPGADEGDRARGLLPRSGRKAGLLAVADGDRRWAGVPRGPRQPGRALRRAGLGRGHARRHGRARDGRARDGRARDGRARHGRPGHGEGRGCEARRGRPAHPLLPQPDGAAGHLGDAQEGLDGDGLHPRLRRRGQRRQRRHRLARQGPAHRRTDRGGRTPGGRPARARPRYRRPRRAAGDGHRDPVGRLRRPCRERHHRRPRPQGAGAGPRLLARDQRRGGPAHRQPRASTARGGACGT